MDKKLMFYQKDLGLQRRSEPTPFSAGTDKNCGF